MLAQTYGSGKDIVLIHGWGFDSSIMDRLMQQLAISNRVTVVDLPGYGSNYQAVFPSTLAELTNLVSPLIPINSVVVGWSLGGLVAMQLALQQEKKVKKVYVIAGTPCFLAKPNWPAMSALAFEKFFITVNKNISRGLDEFIYLNIGGYSFKNAFYKDLKNTIKKTPQKITLLNGLNILSNTDMRNDLINVTCPIQFVLAENDKLIDISIADKLAEYNKNIQTIKIHNMNHALIYFDANLMAKLMV